MNVYFAWPPVSRRRFLAGLAGLAAAALLLGLTACGGRSGPGDDPRADPRNPETVKLGEKVYTQQCTSCHGAKLEGQPDWRQRLPNGRLPAPPHDEKGHTWHHPDHVLFAITKNGVVPPHAPMNYESDMPAFGGKLSDDEIWAALAYIKNHWRTSQVLAARGEMMRNRGSR